MNVHKVSHKTLSKMVEYSIKNKIPLFIEGRSGLGKSTAVHSIAKEHGLEVIDLRAILYDVGDLIMKIPDGDKIKEVVLDRLPRQGSGILFLDELKQAPTEVRRMFYQLILDRALGSTYKLPDGWTIVSASNLDTEIEQDELEGPLYDRFAMRVELESNFENWEEWALQNNVNPIVVSYQKLNPDRHYVVDNDGAVQVTPRRWTWVSEALNKKCDDEIIFSMLPPGISNEFLTYKKRMHVYDNYNEYITGKIEMPASLDDQYAIASLGIANINDESTFKHAVKAEPKFNSEVEVFYKFGAWNRLKGMNKTIKQPMQILAKLDEETRRLTIGMFTKYNWLI